MPPVSTTAPATASPDLVRFAETLASQAGQKALGYFRRPLNIESKSDESPVTVADRDVEALVRARLAEAYPHHGILGEEYGNENLDARNVWVVDPIDGTRSFITGWPIWGTLLSLVEQGTPSIGVIDLPALGERWVGARGQSSRFICGRTGTQDCRTSSCRTLAEASLYSTSPFYFAEGDKAAVEAVARRAHTPRFGGDCYSYGLLASGHIDAVVEALLQPFDYFSLIPVIEGAGGVITDWSGAPLTMRSDGRVVAAATPELHREILDGLRENGAVLG